MEKERNRGLIIIGSAGSGFNSSVHELINAVMIEHEGKVILMDKDNLPEYQKKLELESLLKSEVLSPTIVRRGVIPPNFYKNKGK